MLKVHDAGVKFGPEYVWKDVSFTIDESRFVAIVGPNGSGKSTLLRAIAGLVPLEEGTITLNGESIQQQPQAVAYVPQFTELNRQIPLRGLDFVKLGLNGNRWGMTSKKQNESHAAQIDQLLTALDAKSYAHKGVTELSGGQLQRLRVAQALVSNPKLLLCDEALASLDPKSQEVIVNVINQQRKETQMTVLFVSHEMEALSKVVDRELKVINKNVEWVK